MGGFAALLVGIGIIVLIYALMQRAKVGRVSAPLFKTGALAQGGAAAAGEGGKASVEGGVVCQQPLISPCTGKPCLYFHVKIVGRRKEGEKTTENTLRDDKQAAMFFVDDGSGPLQINAIEGGDFEPEEKFTERTKTGLIGGLVGQELQFGNLRVASGILALGTEYTCEERVLPLQQKLYVNGKMAGNALAKPGFPRSMIISNKSRDEVLGAAQAGAKYSFMGGGGAVAVGAILGVVSSLIGGDEVKADTTAASASAPVAALDAPAPSGSGATEGAAPAAANPKSAMVKPGAGAKPAAAKPGTSAAPAAGTGDKPAEKPAATGDKPADKPPADKGGDKTKTKKEKGKK